MCFPRAVPGTQRVTGYWLEECLRLSRLLDPAQHSFVYRPLPFDLPLPQLANEVK